MTDSIRWTCIVKTYYLNYHCDTKVYDYMAKAYQLNTMVVVKIYPYKFKPATQLTLYFDNMETALKEVKEALE